MLRKIKLAALGLLRGAGAFQLVANSQWRRERLLILCYHGVSLEDEHQWRPQLYMPASLLEKRLRDFARTALFRAAAGRCAYASASRDLPPRSVAITFDDGTYDFYKQAYPAAEEMQLSRHRVSDHVLHRARDADFQPDLFLHAVEAARRAAQWGAGTGAFGASRSEYRSRTAPDRPQL